MNITEDPSTWRVLIVDDEPDNLRLAADLLEFNGATIARAGDGQTGLDVVNEFKPNLILLDLAMPKLDGWEVHRRLRARPEFNEVPIIALTALAMPADVEKARAEGFTGYITKPFRVKALLEELTTTIRAFIKTHASDSTEKPSTEEKPHDQHQSMESNPGR